MKKRETKTRNITRTEELLDEIVEQQKGLFRIVVNELNRITTSLSSLVITIRTEILEDHKERSQ